MKRDIAFKNIETAIQDFTDYFVDRYYGNDASEVYWVADDVGGVLFVNDNFFSFHNMVQYVKYRYTAKEMFEHYDYSLEQHMKEKSPINIENWKQVKKCRLKSS